MGSDREENPSQGHLSNAQHTLVLFITRVSGHSLKGRWDKLQPFPKRQSAEQLLQRLCSHACLCVFGPSWAGWAQGQQLMCPHTSHCSWPHTPALAQTATSFIEPRLLRARQRCASPLACLLIYSDSQLPVVYK